MSKSRSLGLGPGVHESVTSVKPGKPEQSPLHAGTVGLQLKVS
jgi:hypothetical protein